MYRILLADDEKIVVDSISMIINRNFPNQFEIRTARTGRALIEEASQFWPDVAIVDIQMPGINGIDAIREIRKENSNIIIIIMTAYDRFGYAKEAVSLDVMEYMNKPFNSKDITEVLKRTIRRIEVQRKRLSDNLKVREKMEAVTPIIETGFVFHLLFANGQDGEDLENYRELLEIPGEYGCMLTVIAGENQMGSHLTNAVGSGMRLQKSYGVVREQILRTWPNAIVGALISNRIPVFLPGSRPQISYEERVAMIDEARALVRGLRKETDALVRIGIGPITHMKDSMDSYNDALRALESTDGSVAHVDDLPVKCRYDAEYPIELEEKLFASLDKGSPEQCQAAATEYFDWMIANYDQKDMSVRMKCLEFVLFAEYRAYKAGGMTYHFSERADYMPTVYNVERNSDLKSWFVEHFAAACRNRSSRKENYENHMIVRAKEYIQENYCKDISLDDVSRQLNLSSYYFSKLFKAETGTAFVEYLTNLRMDRARTLLKDPDRSIKEICVAVGFSDPNYFSRIFKKNTGLTPTEYREEMG